MHHLVEQSRDIERLYDEAIHSTERVREGNQLLNRSRRHTMDFRKGVLLFLLMSSLALLFLDWYD